MEFMDFNNPFEPKAFHTFEYVQVHVMNMIIKAAVIAACVKAALIYEMSFTQGLVITLVALLLECLIYRKMYKWKKDGASSYAVNEFVAYVSGLTAWGILTLVLYVFGYESKLIRVLSLFIILSFSFAYKTIQLSKELDMISPFYHYDLSGRIVSAFIYSSTILSLGILLFVLLSIPVILIVFLTISVLVIPLYMLIIRPHSTDDYFKDKSFFYRIPFIERRLIKKLLWDYLKDQKLSDTEYEVLDEYPELLAEYFHIQFLLNECLTLYLKGNYDRHYIMGILKDLDELSPFYEKLRQTTENYVKEKNTDEDGYRNRENTDDSERYQNNHHLQFFKNVKTIDELNKEFRKLVKKFHPDSTHGSQEKFIALKSEYDMLKARFTAT